jgi:ribonucleoside-diphosphate reductase alpha chain
MPIEYGPTLDISKEIHQTKYRHDNESFSDAMDRISGALSDDDTHYRTFKDILLNMRFLPAGRVQAAAGSPRKLTAFNCFVSGTIEDSMHGIMQAATDAAFTMRMGGGIGYDFSTLRPRGDRITTLGSRSSGPISFMDIFDSVCGTIASAGHRRGAQMGVLRVDHPDIMEFIRAKQNSTKLTRFNISVGVTDKFMNCVKTGDDFELMFDNRVYDRIDARALWEEIMRSTWDWAEPGVLFLDTANAYNNLWYCEKFAATNPCGEQWLPPYGACLLGSFNLVKYIDYTNGLVSFNFDRFKADIPVVVRAMDNVNDKTIYPLPQQKDEALSKRRMGLGVTGLANAGEVLGLPYGSEKFIEFENDVLKLLKNECYRASAVLAKEKGSFPLFDKTKYMKGKYIATLDKDVRTLISENGIRNSHLTSIAPTGTISLAADNVSSGIEPVFCLHYDRTIQTFNGPKVERVDDYAYRTWGVTGKTSDAVSADEHLAVLICAAKHIDSSVSKTCNVNPNMPWEDFKDIYMKAWEGKAKGVTTFNPAGKRYGILNAVAKSEENEGSACYIDPTTGNKTCDT